MRATGYWLTILVAIAGIGYVVGEGVGADPGGGRSARSGHRKAPREETVAGVVLRGEMFDRVLGGVFRHHVVADRRFLGVLRTLEEPDRGALLRIVYRILEEALASHRGRSFAGEMQAVEAFCPLADHVKREVGEDPRGMLLREGAFTFSPKDREEFVELFLDAFTDEKETAHVVSSLSTERVRALYAALRVEAQRVLDHWVGRNFSSVAKKDGSVRDRLEELRRLVTRDPEGWLDQRGLSSTSMPD